MTNKKMTKDEAIAQLFKSSINFFEKSDELYVEHLKIKEQRIKNNIAFKREQEPLKIFKNAHKKWEIEMEEAEKELFDFYEQVANFKLEQLEFYESLKA